MKQRKIHKDFIKRKFEEMWGKCRSCFGKNVP